MFHPTKQKKPLQFRERSLESYYPQDFWKLKMDLCSFALSSKVLLAIILTLTSLIPIVKGLKGLKSQNKMFNFCLLYYREYLLQILELEAFQFNCITKLMSLYISCFMIQMLEMKVD